MFLKLFFHCVTVQAKDIVKQSLYFGDGKSCLSAQRLRREGCELVRGRYEYWLLQYVFK